MALGVSSLADLQRAGWSNQLPMVGNFPAANSQNQPTCKAALLPPRPLMETIAAIHDIGHPPFGHGGEVALNWIMREHGGFEGNGQTLRILTRLIESSSVRRGANLTRRTLLGALKYPVPWSQCVQDTLHTTHPSRLTGRPLVSEKYHAPPKCYLDTETPTVEWLFEPLHPDERGLIRAERIKSLDCSIMDVADDTAYGIHDLEDGIAVGFIRRDDLESDVPAELWDDFLAVTTTDPALLQHHREAWLSALFGSATKQSIGRLVHYMITSARLSHDSRFATPLYAYRVTLSVPAARLLSALKRSVKNRMILAPALQQIRAKGQRMIVDVFEALSTDPPRLLPYAVQPHWHEATSDAERARTLCDYIASLTDAGLVKLWRRLFDATSGSAFDSLR